MTSMSSAAGAPPATAADFIAMGASPAEAASLVQQADALAGRSGPGARSGVNFEVNNRPVMGTIPAALEPSPAAPPNHGHLSPLEIRESIDAHESTVLERSFDQAMQPPTHGYEYRFPQSVDAPSDEAMAIDSSVKAALHAEQFPAHIVNGIAANLATTAAQTGNETSAEAQSRIASNREALGRMWGANFNDNIARVDRLIEEIGARSPVLKQFIENAAPRLTPIDLDQLLMLANYRANRARR